MILKLTRGVFITRISFLVCTKDGINLFYSELEFRYRFHVPNPILKARENFEGEGNKTFDLKDFRKAPIRIVYDALHGISSVRLNKSIVLS